MPSPFCNTQLICSVQSKLSIVCRKLLNMPINPIYQAAFIEDNLYHIYNRAHKGLKLFYEPEDYWRFLWNIEKHLAPYSDIYAFSLLPNHFHLFLKQNHIPLPLYINNINSVDDFMSEQVRKTCISHTKWINKKYNRYGGLFCSPFKDIYVDSFEYALQLLYYIHWNHVHHDIGTTVSDYPYSSYSHYLFEQPTFIKKDIVLDWFNGKEQFLKEHLAQKDHFASLIQFESKYNIFDV